MPITLPKDGYLRSVALNLSVTPFALIKKRRSWLWKKSVFKVSTFWSSGEHTNLTRATLYARKLKREKIRELWRRACEQAILLGRLERENRSLEGTAPWALCLVPRVVYSQQCKRWLSEPVSADQTPLSVGFLYALLQRLENHCNYSSITEKRKIAVLLVRRKSISFTDIVSFPMQVKGIIVNLVNWYTCLFSCTSGLWSGFYFRRKEQCVA